MEKIELKPCPFCGSRAISRINGHGWYIYCTNCTAGMSVLTNPDECWNKRTIDPATFDCWHQENVHPLEQRIAVLEAKLAARDGVIAGLVEACEGVMADRMFYIRNESPVRITHATIEAIKAAIAAAKETK